MASTTDGPLVVAAGRFGVVMLISGVIESILSEKRKSDPAVTGETVVGCRRVGMQRSEIRNGCSESLARLAQCVHEVDIAFAVPGFANDQHRGDPFGDVQFASIGQFVIVDRCRSAFGLTRTNGVASHDGFLMCAGGSGSKLSSTRAIG